MCPARGQTCIKCGRSNHFAAMCGKFATTKFRSSAPHKHQMNELYHNRTSQTSHNCQSNVQTVPKQAVDIVDMANSIGILTNTYRKLLALDAMKSTSDNVMSTSAYLNIQINVVYIQGKQDTAAKLNAMPLNIYDELKQKLQIGN